MKSETEPRQPAAVGTTVVPPAATRPLALERAPVVLAVAAIVVCLVLPRAAPASLAMMLAAVILLAPRRPGLGDLGAPPLPVIAALGLAGWALLSVVWAADRNEALGKALMVALFTVAAWVTCIGFRIADRRLFREAERALVVAFCCSLAYLLFEETTEHLIKRALFELVPLFRPPAKHTTVGDGAAPLVVAAFITNRNMAAMTLALWPCVLLIAHASNAWWRPLLIVLSIVATMLAALISAHETSVIALLVSALVLGIALWLPRIAIGVVAAAWLAATLFVVPMVSTAFHQGQLYNANWIPNSARHRIVIWAYTAEQVASRPLLGIGAASTKLVDARRGPKVEVVPGTRYEWRSSPHAHNVYLQTWYELGAVGAAVLAALGLGILQQIRGLPPRVAPYALATFAAAAVIGAFSWGMWQAWFLAVFAFAAILVALAAKAATAEAGQ